MKILSSTSSTKRFYIALAMKFREITTDRMFLREITPAVLQYLHEEAPESELMEILGIQTDEDLIKEKKRYKNGRWTFNKHFSYFQMILQNEDRIIGWCGYHTWYLDHNRAELGYELYDEKDREKGLMSEAIIPIIDFGFENLNLHRIEALVGPSNSASLKILNRLGFKKEGHLKEHYKRNGKWEDSLVYALFR